MSHNVAIVVVDVFGILEQLFVVGSNDVIAAGAIHFVMIVVVIRRHRL